MPPIFRQVQESDVKSLQKHLESMSSLSAHFLVLLSGSTLIASLGLFQNSPAVIIGAMIIAPLMRPLVGLSLGILTGDTKLILKAVVTIITGTLLSICISASLAFVCRSLELTPEILSRTHPTLLDLGVAFFAGAIGAYCQADAKLSESLAGVAISVALVPPLSVVGIGLCFGSHSVFTGAALLYATNLIGITVAGALVFLVMGYTPLHQAKKGLLVSAVVSVFLIVPLALSMRELVLENQISIKTKNILQEKTVTFRGMQLGEVKVERFKEPMIVVATVFSPDRPISPNQVKLVQEFLAKELNVPLKFKLRLIPVTVVTDSEAIVEPPIFIPKQPEKTVNSPTTEPSRTGTNTDDLSTESGETEAANENSHSSGVLDAEKDDSNKSGALDAEKDNSDKPEETTKETVTGSDEPAPDQ